MANKIKIQHGQTVALKLIPEERAILLENLIFVDDELEQRLRLVVAGAQEVQLNLEDLEDLAGCVAAEANHTKDKRLEKQLDRIWERVEGLLELFEDPARLDVTSVADFVDGTCPSFVVAPRTIP